MTLKQEHSDNSTNLETVAALAMPVVGVGFAVEAASAYGYIDPAIHELPGADHMSSVAGGYAVGVVGGAIAERFAGRLESMGRPGSAERARRIGNVVTALGSFATQVVLEASTHGTGDKWDVVSGVLASAPGILAGRKLVKEVRKTT